MYDGTHERHSRDPASRSCSSCPLRHVADHGVRHPPDAVGPSWSGRASQPRGQNCYCVRGIGAALWRRRGLVRRRTPAEARDRSVTVERSGPGARTHPPRSTFWTLRLCCRDRLFRCCSVVAAMGLDRLSSIRGVVSIRHLQPASSSTLPESHKRERPHPRTFEAPPFRVLGNVGRRERTLVCSH